MTGPVLACREFRDRAGETVKPTTDDVLYGTGPADVVKVRDMAAEIYRWRWTHDVVTRPLKRSDDMIEPGLRAMVPVSARMATARLVGKGGLDYLARATDPLAEGGDILVYKLPDTWAPLLEEARTVSARHLVEATGLHPKTVADLLAGRNRPRPESLELIRLALKRLGKRPNASEDRRCARAGCKNRVAANRKLCGSEACDRAVRRARHRFEAVPVEIGPRVWSFTCAMHGTFAGDLLTCPQCGPKPRKLPWICPRCGAIWPSGFDSCDCEVS